MYKNIKRSSYQLNWNSHRRVWSVRLNGLVVDSVKEGCLIKATFKHPKSGRGRSRRPSIYSSQPDWYPDIGICGNYKTQLPVKYIHGSSKWYVYESCGQPNTPILEFRAVFLTPEGNVFINPMLGEYELKVHLGIAEGEKLF